VDDAGIEVHDAVVIGAGPAGLAAAAALGARGVDAVVLEREALAGASWRCRYDGLRLNSMRVFSNLPGLAIPRCYGRYVAREDYVAYLEAYEKLQRLAVRYRCEVVRVERDRATDSWQLRTKEFALRSQVLVVATGYDAHPTMPEWATSDEFDGEVLHSSALHSLAAYRGRRVLIVGAGNSGVDLAGLLDKVGAHVTLAMRSAPNIFPREWHGLPLQMLGIAGEYLPVSMTDRSGMSLQRRIFGDLTPYGIPPASEGMRATYRDHRRNPAVDDGFVAAIQDGRIRVVAPVMSLAGAEAVLVDETRVPCDAVICATGFSRALESLVGHLGVLGADGVPTDERGAPADVRTPGLYFIGFDATPTGHLRRINIQARRIARDVASRRSFARGFHPVNSRSTWPRAREGRGPLFEV
jgi:cation diffusion facilitator CzcD-associated flavoprotein CzcO